MGNVMDNIEKNSNINIEHLKKIYFWRNAFFGLIILAAGIAIGGAIMSILSERKLDNASPPPIEASNNLMPRLRQTLGLTQEQVSKIRPILDSHIQKLLQIRENARVEIYNTLEQMGKEINPELGEIQKRVWQQELLRIQRDFSPAPLRPGVGAGAGRGRRGAEQPAQGGRGYRGGRGQLDQPPPPQPMNGRPGRGFEPPPDAPNSSLNNIIQNEMPSGGMESNDVNE
jgi:hypothetical protein